MSFHIKLNIVVLIQNRSLYRIKLIIALKRQRLTRVHSLKVRNSQNFHNNAEPFCKIIEILIGDLFTHLLLNIKLLVDLYKYISGTYRDECMF